jgi:hypothetical protein
VDIMLPATLRRVEARGGRGRHPRARVTAFPEASGRPHLASKLGKLAPLDHGGLFIELAPGVTSLGPTATIQLTRINCLRVRPHMGGPQVTGRNFR